MPLQLHRSKLKIFHKVLISFSLCLLLLVIFALNLVRGSGAVKFHQFEYQKMMLNRTPFDTSLILDTIHSSLFYVPELFYRRLLGNVPDSSNVITKDPLSIFKFIFAHLPSYLVVYPTETYYYYYFNTQNRTIAGNIRMLNLSDGVIHIGYFDRNDPRSELGGSASFNAKDGFKVYKISDFLFDMSFEGRNIRVRVNDIALKNPEIKLLAEEEFVCQVLDESGVNFILLYNNKTKSFYFILNNESPFPGTFTPLQDENFIYDQRTQFVFYVDKEFNRKELVGVAIKNVELNTYFDGPFDQVPPRLELKEKLTAAYPYTVYRGGIDAHGNFANLKDERMAISPYVQYTDTNSLLSYLKRCEKNTSKSDLWSCLAYEWKKDFHKTLENAPSEGVHYLPISQGWPANHEGNLSNRWPKDHKKIQSHVWPADHNAEKSILNVGIK